MARCIRNSWEIVVFHALPMLGLTHLQMGAMWYHIVIFNWTYITKEFMHPIKYLKAILVYLSICCLITSARLLYYLYSLPHIQSLSAMWNSRIPPRNTRLLLAYLSLQLPIYFNCSILQILQKNFLPTFFSQDLVFKNKQNICISNQGEPSRAIIRCPLTGYAGLLQ